MPPAAATARSAVCPAAVGLALSAQLLQDDREALLVRVAVVGPRRRGVAELRAQPGVVQQPPGLIDKLVEIAERQYLVAGGEEAGHCRPEFGQHRGTAAGRLEQAQVDSRYL